MRGNTLDALERIFWTFIQAFLGALLASPFFDNLGLGWQDSLKVALFAGLVSVAKNVIAIAALHTPSTVEAIPPSEGNPPSV